MLIETTLEIHPSEQASCLMLKFPQWAFWAEELHVCEATVALNALDVRELPATIHMDWGGLEDRDTVGRIDVRVPIDGKTYQWNITHAFTREHLYDLEDRIIYQLDMEKERASD